MKRRPHWDDDLITAVCATGDDGEVDYWMTSDQVYRIIAAVEDWHEKFVMHGAFRVLAERAASAEADRDRLANQLLNEVPDSYIQMKARALTAEATIQRVREELEAWKGGSVATARILRALDDNKGVNND